jgi:hypothetical protein
MRRFRSISGGWLHSALSLRRQGCVTGGMADYRIDCVNKPDRNSRTNISPMWAARSPTAVVVGSAGR